MDFKDKFRGSLLGTAVGDSIGKFFEGSARLDQNNVESKVLEQRELTWTDDTQMTIGLAESLVEREGFDGEHMAKLFARNYDPARGYGPSTSKVLERIRRGEPWDLPANDTIWGEGSYGNGAAMRIAPVGLLYGGNLGKVREIAEATSRITHTHPLGVDGAVLQAQAVALAAQSVPGEDFLPEEFLKALVEQTGNEMYVKKLEKVGQLLKSPGDVAKELGNGMEAFNSVPAAIYSFLVSPMKFKDAVSGAVALGGDADTIGAMTGAISGAYLGASSIPADWIDKLEQRATLEVLSDKLFMMFAKETLGGKCETCMTEKDVGVYKIDEDGPDDLQNFILHCPRCKQESEAEKEDLLAKPKKTGKYRAVYRKVYGKTRSAGRG